ncbi:acetyltransferase [Nonlabens sp. MIC269]|uniref:hypothetical protein n=1 Tax=Nonlabens sp. MIC269 TaxID=1476901 RepID=UPI0007211F3D|nr:hypothetical protein [Nonlabens sp. MIC269]ALM21073.1 acetyltransferase [Nonlabens sp. MIC269]
MSRTNSKLYFELGEQLPKQYPELNFDNHCYWRIALDNVLQGKWRDKIPAPAYKHLTDDQLDYVIHLLKSYSKDQRLLLQHNENSLRYRGKIK